MKHILCFGDSNTWGFDGDRLGKQFAPEAVWHSVMAKELGSDYRVFPAGLCSRTTVFEDPLREGKRGINDIAAAVTAAVPLDLLIIMLGTNDCKDGMNASAQDIAHGLEALADEACGQFAWGNQQHVLLVAPVMIHPVYKESWLGDEMGEACREKCAQLPGLYRELAQRRGWHFFDSNVCCTVNMVDGIHLDEGSHRRLGEQLSPVVKGILNV